MSHKRENISLVPNVLLIKILVQLSKIDMGTLCLVNKAWNTKVCQNSSIWKSKSLSWSDPLVINRWYFGHSLKTYVWGSNYNKNLSIAWPQDILNLTLVNGLTNVKDFSDSAWHSCLLTWGNEAYTAGQTKFGERGNGSGLISLLSTNVQSIGCLGRETYILGLDHILYGTGEIEMDRYVFTSIGLTQLPEETKIYNMDKIMSNVENITKLILYDYGYLMIQIQGHPEGNVYLNKDPTRSNVMSFLGNGRTLQVEKIFFDRDGHQVQMNAMTPTSDPYWCLYKLKFMVPGMSPITNFVDLSFNQKEEFGFILDSNRHIYWVQINRGYAVYRRLDIQNVQSAKLIYPILYWLDFSGKMYGYNVTTDENVQYFERTIRSIHKFRKTVLVLGDDGTIFLSGLVDQKVVEFIGWKRLNELKQQFGNSAVYDQIVPFVPIYNNVEAIFVDNFRIVIVVLPSFTL